MHEFKKGQKISHTLSEWESFWFNKLKTNNAEFIYSAWLAEYNRHTMKVFENESGTIHLEESKMKVKTALSAILTFCNDAVCALVLDNISGLVEKGAITSIFISFLFDEYIANGYFNAIALEESDSISFCDRTRLINALIIDNDCIDKTSSKTISFKLLDSAMGLRKINPLQSIIFNYNIQQDKLNIKPQAKLQTLMAALKLISVTLDNNFQWKYIIKRDLLTYKIMKIDDVKNILFSSDAIINSELSDTFLDHCLVEACSGKDYHLFEEIKITTGLPYNSAEDIIVEKAAATVMVRKSDFNNDEPALNPFLFTLYRSISKENPGLFLDKLTKEKNIVDCLWMLDITPMDALKTVNSHFVRMKLLQQISNI